MIIFFSVRPAGELVCYDFSTLLLDSKFTENPSTFLLKYVFDSIFTHLKLVIVSAP